MSQASKKKSESQKAERPTREATEVKDRRKKTTERRAIDSDGKGCRVWKEGVGGRRDRERGKNGRDGKRVEGRRVTRQSGLRRVPWCVARG